MKPHLVILGAGPSPDQGLPLGLQKVTLERRVLDWQLDAFAALAPEVSFVGGYDIEQVMRHFPKLAYHFNADWQSTGSVASLALALDSLADLAEGQRDLYVAYSDILLRPELVQGLAGMPADRVVVAIDTPAAADERGAKRPETIALDGMTREFVGLIRVPAPRVPAFRSQVLALAGDMRRAHLSRLLAELAARSGWSPAGVFATRNWAHAEHGRSVARFVMGSKAATLDRLQNRLKRSKILSLAYFTRTAYATEREATLRALVERFGTQGLLIVRSSATDEDGFARANAGRYHSELNVPPTVEGLGRAVDMVFQSYAGNDPLDEVLVQPQLEGVRASGVMFTRTLETGAPYRVINYTEGSDTTAITAGASRDGVKLYVSRMAPPAALERLPELGRRLVQSADEIEACVCHDALDIEFALDADGQLVTLQVRPLMVSDAHQDRGRDEDVADSLSGIHETLRQLTPPPPGQVGRQTAWSVMADWNPAEIVGLTPAPLALDLYRKIITDRVWAQQRHEVGYRDVREWPLIRSFGGQAFVDVRASLNSFLPASLPDALAQSLIEYALARLEADPSLHDKLEFELVPTCLDFGYQDWERRYLTAGTCRAEDLAVLREGLRQVTRAIVARAPRDIAYAQRLETECPALARVREPFADWLRAVLHTCSAQGALCFAHLARGGFVVAALLRSAVARGLLTDERRALLMESISGVGRMLTDAAALVRAGQLSREAFIERFGHLRPGTYDITMPAYRDQPALYLDPIIAVSHVPALPVFAWTPQEREALASPLAKLDIGLDADGLLAFAHQAVAGREYAKFVFTRLLSAALDGLTQQAQKAGIPAELHDSMPLSVWLDQSVEAWGRAEARQALAEQTVRRHRQHRLASLIFLPPVLTGADEIHAFEVPHSEPTFITTRKAQAVLRVVHPGQVVERQQVEGCVVAITNADPGFDYLFALGIRGLMTAYGGPNSHMAIRASEFSIAAVIGIGSEGFAQLRDGAMIDLDCQKRRWLQEGGL
ncbi:PEP-utilizing enzyme [uncultured Rhodoferax sp.]|uniref:PEP-utilizing enzyme n=1 Tax=uncultured Rhodoferax sp. TaxID=223188 RepID=UPI0025E1E035|nr:PEP-utilizing enzyme [uncultured Rhodoferax sp.]